MAHSSRDDWSEAALNRLAAALKATSSEHPDPGVLGEFAYARQEYTDAAVREEFPEVLQHLAVGCDQCAANLAQLGDLVAITSSGLLDSPPSSLLSPRQPPNPHSRPLAKHLALAATVLIVVSAAAVVHWI